MEYLGGSNVVTKVFIRERGRQEIQRRFISKEVKQDHIRYLCLHGSENHVGTLSSKMRSQEVED